VIVLAIGGNEQTSREAWNRKHMGDRTSLDLIGRQEELVKAMLATGKPVVVLFFNGRPLSINYVAQNVPAIFECWYLGQECGHAVADVLFGDFNPGGKLPIHSAFRRPSAGVLQSQALGAARLFVRRRFAAVRVRLRLELHDVQIQKSSGWQRKNPRGGSTRVLVDVTNTGKRAGTEVVQMYIRDLRQFGDAAGEGIERLPENFIAPGETKTVALDITPESLAFYDMNMKYTVEPGEFEIMVGNSSRDAICRR
jgi:beta-glucosidase